MKTLFLTKLLAVYFVANLFAGVETGDVTYTGAVVEYEPYNVWTDDEKGYGVINENAAVIIDYAKMASLKGADIMVTPEYGLQSLDMFDNETDKFITYTQLVPDPKLSMNPCRSGESNDYFQGMITLSCGAAQYQIYLVIDLAEMEPCSEDTVSLSPWPLSPVDGCPESGYFFYNTQVVFDREGTVIARYRKQHLFLEDALTPGPSDDATAIFLTDFDVLFSLQICFDIVFEHPGYYNVKNLGLKDVVMSTAWVDYLPFELADAVQSGWSRGLGVNLLVAGYHDPERKKLGSGIYRGYANHESVYTYDKNSGDCLVVSNVTTMPASDLAAGPLKYLLETLKHREPYLETLKHRKPSLKTPKHREPSLDTPKHGEPSQHMQIIYESFAEEYQNRTHNIFHENLRTYNYTDLTKGEVGVNLTATACSFDNLCCHLTYQYSGDLNYKLLAFSGQFPVGYGRYFIGIQHCAVVWCKTNYINSCAIIETGLPDSDTFGPFTISSETFIMDSIYASAVHRDLTLVNNSDVDLRNSDSLFTLTVSASVTDLLEADLMCRWYGNDGVEGNE